MAALHERLRFDVARGEVLDDDRRYVLLRADVLMGVFDLLPATERVLALRAFGRSVHERGSQSVRAYASTLAGDADALFGAVADGAASLGWGAWRYEREPQGHRLHVRNSPFARYSRNPLGPCCAPIAGMFQALCEQTEGQAMTVLEICCAAVTTANEKSTGECVFVARQAQPEEG